MKIVKEGHKNIKIFISLVLIFFIISQAFNLLFFNILSIICLALTLFSIYFFRNPKRLIVAGTNDILCPADGVIMEIAEENNEIIGKCTVIRIFLSVFDVHVQRAPIDGIITKIEYKTGKFLPAMNPKAHIENEQNIVIFQDKNDSKKQVICNQIAGLIARTIVMWKKEQDTLNIGELYGMIKFGSQVDVYLPLDSTEIKIKQGQKVSAGTTLIANWRI